MSCEHRARKAVTTMRAVPPRPAVQTVGLRSGSAGIYAGDLGHDVDTVTDEDLVGAPDRDVMAAAAAAGRILIGWLAIVRERC